MATETQTDLLAAILERSPEGLGVPADTLRPLGGPTFDADLAALQADGFLSVVDRGRGDEPDTVAITDAGRALLERLARRS